MRSRRKAEGILDIIEIGDIVVKRGKLYKVVDISECKNKRVNSEDGFKNCAICVGQIKLEKNDPEDKDDVYDLFDCYGIGEVNTVISEVIKNNFFDEDDFSI